eukprot:scaffold15036_cov73-Skeletonema_marinoi.AAC.1
MKSDEVSREILSHVAAAGEEEAIKSMSINTKSASHCRSAAGVRRGVACFAASVDQGNTLS